MMKILVNVVPMMTAVVSQELYTIGDYRNPCDSEIDNSSDEQEEENKRMIGRGVHKFVCRQYMHLKAIKFAIKTYELCKFSSGCVWSFLKVTTIFCSRKLTH
jgi:hypothetical protein